MVKLFIYEKENVEEIYTQRTFFFLVNSNNNEREKLGKILVK